MTRVVAASLVVALALSPACKKGSDKSGSSSAADEDDPCASSVADSCENCAGTLRQGQACGWCEDVGKCASGDATGPKNKACAKKDFTLSPLKCKDKCEGAKSCGACGKQEGCGWCTHTMMCQSGDNAGPAKGRCAPEDWKYGGVGCR